MFCVFAQLRKHLNDQRGELLKAQQRSLKVRQQQKDAVVGRTAELDELKQSAAVSLRASERSETSRANTSNSGPETQGMNIASVARKPEIHNTGDNSLSQATAVHRPVILKPTASMRKHISSSGSKDENFGRRTTPDLPVHVDCPVSLHTASAANSRSEKPHRDVCSLPLRPDVVKSSSHKDKLTVDDKPSLLSDDLSEGIHRACSSVTQSSLPFVSTHPLSVTVTNTSVTNLPHYFERLDVSQLAANGANHVHDDHSSESSEGSAIGYPVPTTKPKCVFASKSMIASTYLNRRAPVFSPPVHVGTPSVSASGHSLPISCVDSNQTQSTADTIRCAAANSVSHPSRSQQSSVDELLVNSVSSPVVPPRLSYNKDGQIHSSSPKLAESSTTEPHISETALTADRPCNGAEPSSSSNSIENSCPRSLMTVYVLSSNSLPTVATCRPLAVPLNTAFSADMLSVSQLPHVLSYGLQSAAVSHSCAHVVLSSDVTTVAALPGIISVSQANESANQPLTNSIPPSLTVPRYAVPCMLTISTHIPVSSPSIDTVVSSLQTTLPDVINNSIAAVGSSCDLTRICVTSSAIDISSSSLLSQSNEVALTQVSGEIVESSGDDEVPLAVEDLPDAPQMSTGSPRMTRRRRSSEGAHVGHGSSAAVLQKDVIDSLEQTAERNETAEEQMRYDQESSGSVAAELSELEADVLSDDDASSDIVPLEGEPEPVPVTQALFTKQKRNDGSKTLQRVSFSPLALLLDASLEGDLELVMNTAKQVHL